MQFIKGMRPELLFSCAIATYGISRGGRLGLSLTLAAGALGYLLWMEEQREPEAGRPRLRAVGPEAGEAPAPVALLARSSPVRDGDLDQRDTVEEASWESFPASDPPAW